MLQKIKKLSRLFIPPIFLNCWRRFKNISESMSKPIESYGLNYPNEFKGFEFMNRYKYYDKGLSRIVKIIKEEKYNDLSLIDVGANIGDSVAVLRQTVFCPIMAVEGNDEYFNYLKGNCNKYPNIELVKVFLGEKDEIKKVKSVKKDGTAHLEKSDSKLEILSLDTLLKKYPQFQYAKLIKIDTDGYDNAILRGSLSYLTVSKPIIFMEYDPNFLEDQNDNGIDIFSYLLDLGYERAIMYANFGDYMFSFTLSNFEFIEEMREYFYKNDKIPYSDLCVFHKNDNDLYQNVRKAELDYFNKEKRCNK